MTRFVALTAPDDRPVWIEIGSIEKFMPSLDHPGGTLIWSFAGIQEVKETPAEVLRRCQTT